MKLTDNIHLLKIDFEIPLKSKKKIRRYVNAILVFSDKITLIDTGVKGSEKFIFEYIKSQNRDYTEIDRIILSHSHPDHIGGARIIKDLTNCRIYADKSERNWIEDIETQYTERPVPGFYTLADRPVRIDDFLDDNQKIMAGKDLTIRIIRSPGHSKGSINVLFREDRILFTADSIPLKNDIPNYDNYFDLLDSLKRIKNNNEYDTLLTSWTPPLTDQAEIHNIIDEGEEYIEMIDSAVKECYGFPVRSSEESCRLTIEKLGLPPFFANPLSDRAFRSHLLK